MTSNSASSSPIPVHGDTLTALQQLIEVVAQLRSPEGGCPWDLEQTPQTLIPYIVEEAYETIAAIRSGQTEAIAEELGDLLLQVVLQAQIAGERGDFTLEGVARGITEKLIRRHPHVFGDVEAQTIDEVRQSWEQIKAAEKGETGKTPRLSTKLDRHARTLPPLMAAIKISQKAAGVGFEWENIDGVWEKFHEELAEFQQALEHETKKRQEEELGDLLFVITNLARWAHLDPSAALQGSSQRFVERFSWLESAIDRPISDCTLEEFEVLWRAAKASLAKSSKISD
ncbi:nucleoside triphosphate pyrophosphohydrolase [Oscillatoriales cyanobacterium LEGE 11467]|uniref:Nucleoside triphosphate pyrophosphohydrolase n=1 Tax=Zarconia navalis LEGE 11467 TaxID=1828826 RepID=A0A928VW25_9CYAN|nr:nucleoside triphosphate pyrophosphohydrolase [Zarconia navalis]MBE9039286.1 nucleoside triphosphate pyrophosphohydrolase [Zarconia navalis LEGE 11467]